MREAWRYIVSFCMACAACFQDGERAATKAVLFIASCFLENFPCVQLPEPLTGQDRTLDEISAGASATLVMFISNHCPFVKLLKGVVFSLHV